MDEPQGTTRPPATGDATAPTTGAPTASTPGPAAPPTTAPPAPTTDATDQPRELTLIGAGHVFQIQRTIHEAIVAMAPDVVFVELDRGRLQALLARERGETGPAGGGFVQKRLQRFQEGVASMYGAQAGAEMLAAVRGAQAIGAKVLLIDPPAQDTLRKALKQITWRERFRAAGMVISGLGRAAWPFGRRNAKKKIESELRSYQEDPEKAMQELRRQFPTLYRVVIEERDAIMSARIEAAMKTHQRGVAVLGDGHIGGMQKRLAALAPKVYRLGDVREGRLPGAGAVGTAERVAYGFELKMG